MSDHLLLASFRVLSLEIENFNLKLKKVKPGKRRVFSNLNFYSILRPFLETYSSPLELFIVRILPMFFNEPCDLLLSIQLSYNYFPPGKNVSGIRYAF